MDRARFQLEWQSLLHQRNWKANVVSVMPRWSQQAIVSALFAVMFVGFALFLPGFLNPDNMLGLLQSVATLGILGLGMGMIVIGRGIDLSMIATLSIPPAAILQMVGQGANPWQCLAGALVGTLLFGAFNGWLIAYAEVSALFTTLASGLLLSGAVAFFQIDIVIWPEGLASWRWLGQSTVLGVPMPVVFFIGAALWIGLFLKRTRIGQFIYAMGDNLAAARTAGIATRPMTVLLYTLSALIGAFTGLVLAASLNTMPLRIFTSTLMYDVILVVVLGGIGLSGGRGGASSVIVGTLLIGTLLNAMTLLDASVSVQNFTKGVILLGAIIADTLLNPRNEETAQQGDI